MRFILRELERDDHQTSKSSLSFFNSSNNDDKSSQSSSSSSSLSIFDQNQLIKNEEDYQIEVFERK